MSRRRIPWDRGSWTNEPVAAVVDEHGHLHVEAVEGSDYWQKTMYGFENSNGHAYLTPWKPSDAMEVTLRLDAFDGRFEQGGLMVWHSPTKWIKTGFELNDGILYIGAVATDEYSDWSLFPIPQGWMGQELTMRASVIEDAIMIRARVTESNWVTLRATRFPYADALQAGPYLCAPDSKGLKIRFVDWALTTADEDAHVDPPIETYE